MKIARFWLAAALCGPAWAAAPAYSPAGIVNASNFAPGPFAPNSVISIFGTGLAWSPQGLNPGTAQLPTTLGGVEVFVSDSPAPLFYVSDLQINFLMPTNQAPGLATVRVVRQGVSGPDVPVTVVDAAPALFSLPVAPAYAIAQHWPDYGLVDAGSPVERGGVVILYATGLGRTQPYPQRTEIPQYAGVMVRFQELRVYVAGKQLDPAAVLWAGLSPGSAGLYQINLKIPGDAPPDPEIRVAIGDQMSAAGLNLAVR